MKKTKFIQIGDEVKRIVENSNRTLEKLKNLTSGVDLLFKGKFGKLGTKWNTENAENEDDLCEQLQQSMTMLTTFYAMVEYFPEYDLDSWKLSAGDKNGPDLYNDKVMCEVFAAKTPGQNQKLYKDLNALVKKSKNPKYVCDDDETPKLYVFCCSPKDIPMSPKTEECFNLKINANQSIKASTGEKNSGNWKIYTAQWGEEKGNSATIVHITDKTLREWVEQLLSSPCNDQ